MLKLPRLLIVASILLFLLQSSLCEGNQPPPSTHGPPQGQGYHQDQWGPPPGQIDDNQGYLGSQPSRYLPYEGQEPPTGQQYGSSFNDPLREHAYGQQHQGGQMRPTSSQYSEQLGGSYGSPPGFGQQQGYPSHQDRVSGGLNIGGLLNKAKNIASSAANVASVFVAGGPDLVAPPQFQDQQQGQQIQQMQGGGYGCGSGAPGTDPFGHMPVRTSPGGHHGSNMQEERSKRFGDTVAGGMSNLFGKVKGFFNDDDDDDDDGVDRLTRATLEADKMAAEKLFLFVVPLVLANSARSLLYDMHCSWYSWFISSLTASVYAFGFVLMVPQLYINHQLKSVSRLPWKFLVYKFINTFIDDLFAFVIKMPLMHRLSVFRDDIIFLIYLYQRYIYAVDESRPIEK